MPKQTDNAGIIDFDYLLRQGETIMAESGGSDGFDATAWLTDWLQAPVPAFGGRSPQDYMTTPEGRQLVSNTIAQMQSGTDA